MLQQPNSGSNLAAQRRFNSFWSNVSHITIKESASTDTVAAIVEAVQVTQAQPRIFESI